MRLEGSCQGVNKNRRVSDNIAHAMQFVRRTRDVVNRLGHWRSRCDQLESRRTSTIRAEVFYVIFFLVPP